MTDEDYRALSEFRSQLRRFLRKSEDAAAAVGLQPQQYQVLLMVKGLEADSIEPTITQIADRLYLRHHSVVGLIDRLEKNELVSRRRAGLDQRNVIISLTDEGDRLIQKLSRFHQEALRSLGPDLVRSLQGVIAGAEGAVEGASQTR
jgi:DNA-binding MarR family transcriptional regulator